MNDQSPYQPPLQQGPPSIPINMMGVPPEVNVFGILHLVFAGFGVITAAWTLVIAATGNPFLKMMAANPQMSAQIEAQTAMQERIRPMTITAAILSLLVAVPMIIAGIKLVKRRKSGLKWSNIYAWTSLGAKLVKLVLTALILVPAMEEMTQGMFSGSHPVPGVDPGTMSGFMAVATGGGVLLTCIYPILTLVMLNRSSTKEWFRSLPSD